MTAPQDSRTAFREAKVAALAAQESERMRDERRQIALAMEAASNNRERAAAMLGITVKVLTWRLAKHRVALRRGD